MSEEWGDKILIWGGEEKRGERSTEWGRERERKENTLRCRGGG